MKQIAWIGPSSRLIHLLAQMLYKIYFSSCAGPTSLSPFCSTQLYYFANERSWKREMLKTMNENGLQNTLVHRIEYNKTMARLWNDVYMSTWEEFAKVVLKTPDMSSQLAHYAMGQVREGSAISCPMIVWVAQKA
jgi:hypothetical protein